MHPSYEYIFAALMIFAMLGATVTTMLPLADVNLSEAYEYQLEVIADRVLNKILRTPGYPADWGVDLSINYSDTSAIEDFGLALAGTGNAYVLDPNKVTKLENNSRLDNPYYIPPRDAAEILGLGREYGFSLNIVPALNINVTSFDQNRIYLQVKSQENIPTPNADVSALAIWRQGNKMFNETCSNMTDWRGECMLEFSEDIGSKAQSDEGIALITFADFHGIKTVSVTGASETMVGSVSGRYVSVVYPPRENGTWQIQGEPLLVVFPNVFVGEIVNGSKGREKWTLNRGKKNYTVFELSWIDPYTNFVILVAKHTGDFRLVTVPRPLDVHYQTGPLAGLHRVTLHRLVTINGLTHYVRFSIWRMSE